MITVKSYLYSIMYNLLSNAIKYRSSEVPLTIHLNTLQDKDNICLSVKDNGMGIDMKKHGDKIFGLYNRFHGKKIEGKGIGLNLVRAQAESLGGKVEVGSTVNHGSTFKIFLPLNHHESA
jgi:signal transduction histidine kinase